METVDSSNISFYTLLFQSQNWDFLVNSFSFMVHFCISYSPEMTEYHGLGLVHFFVDICSENNQVHFRYPSSNILVMTNFDSSWSVLDFEWKPWNFFSLLILGSVVADDSCSLYTGVGGKESVLLVPQITLKSSCFQSLFHDMKHGMIWNMALQMLSVPMSSVIADRVNYLAQVVFLQESSFLVREFSVPLFVTLGDALIFTCQDVTWAHSQKSHGLMKGFTIAKELNKGGVWYGGTWKYFWAKRTWLLLITIWFLMCLISWRGKNILSIKALCLELIYSSFWIF